MTIVAERSHGWRNGMEGDSWNSNALLKAGTAAGMQS
jgi:hypothetical protein